VAGIARKRFLGLALVALLLFPLLQLACDSPPQILEISPGRGARDVATNAPIRIRFDRPLDRGSVAARFSLRPKTSGQVSWEAPNTLVYQHDTLDANTQYGVSLVAGYRDAAGKVNGFNHSWTFQTEVPPELRTTTPGQGDRQVDPATYLGLSFSREMAADSFRGAVTFSPAVPFAVRSDPSDAKRVLIAPKSLLDPLTAYDVSISGNATDEDGNHLHPARLHFTTGSVRSLSRWITFVASEAGAASGSGVWMVDEAGFPRILEETPADAFSWSPDGANLLIRHPDLSWTDFPLGADPVPMPFSAEWAAYLRLCLPGWLPARSPPPIGGDRYRRRRCVASRRHPRPEPDRLQPEQRLRHRYPRLRRPAPSPVSPPARARSGDQPGLVAGRNQARLRHGRRGRAGRAAGEVARRVGRGEHRRNRRDRDARLARQLEQPHLQCQTGERRQGTVADLPGQHRPRARSAQRGRRDRAGWRRRRLPTATFP